MLCIYSLASWTMEDISKDFSFPGCRESVLHNTEPHIHVEKTLELNSSRLKTNEGPVYIPQDKSFLKLPASTTWEQLGAPTNLQNQNPRVSCTMRGIYSSKYWQMHIGPIRVRHLQPAPSISSSFRSEETLLPFCLV